LFFNVFQASRPNPNANAVLAAPLPIDLSRFAAKPADEKSNASLANSSIALIVVRSGAGANGELENHPWTKTSRAK
jgi:hypothetical protein